jgi:DNA polymerase III delta prime subunit
MAIALSSLRQVRADKPPRVLIYGPPGIGKTTLASEFPSPVFIQVEDGTPGDVELTSFGKLNSFGEVMDALAALYTDDHGFRTVVVDSVTELERFVYAETCARGDDKGNPKANIEDFGYGKGYTYAQRIWSEFLEGCNALRRDRGMGVVLIAHSKVERFDDPETVSYDRYEIDLHNKSVGAIEREMDAIFLLKQPVTVKTEDKGFNKERARAAGGDAVLIHAIGKPAFVAKNRYGIPATVRFDRGQGYAVLSTYLPGAVAEPAKPAKKKAA